PAVQQQGQPAFQQQQQAPAQQPAVALDPKNNKLDALLLNWEATVQGMQAFSADCVRTKVDKTFNTTEVFGGKAKYMKPDLASLELVRQGNPQLYEKYICTGTFLYEYVPAQKEIRAHELPRGKSGQVADDGFLALLFGMKAADAKQ